MTAFFMDTSTVIKRYVAETGIFNNVQHL